MPRDMDDENNMFGMEEGCPEHGSERMAECTACGEEFCTLCFPRSAVCADCAEGGGLDEDAKEEDYADADKPDKNLEDEDADEESP